jgi:hypothetical protein
MISSARSDPLLEEDINDTDFYAKNSRKPEIDNLTDDDDNNNNNQNPKNSTAHELPSLKASIRFAINNEDAKAYYYENNHGYLFRLDMFYRRADDDLETEDQNDLLQTARANSNRNEVERLEKLKTTYNKQRTHTHNDEQYELPENKKKVVRQTHFASQLAKLIEIVHTDLLNFNPNEIMSKENQRICQLFNVTSSLVEILCISCEEFVYDWLETNNGIQTLKLFLSDYKRISEKFSGSEGNQFFVRKCYIQFINAISHIKLVLLNNGNYEIVNRLNFSRDLLVLLQTIGLDNDVLVHLIISIYLSLSNITRKDDIKSLDRIHVEIAFSFLVRLVEFIHSCRKSSINYDSIEIQNSNKASETKSNSSLF